MAISMKTSVSASGVRASFAGRRVARVANGSRVTMKAGNWLPGSDTPAWLKDDLIGNYGFDPAGLAKDPASLARFQEAEVYHCRWAMLGVAGALGVEVLGYGTWADAPLWAVTGGKATYFGAEIPFDLNTLTGIEFVAFAAAESARGAEPNAEKRTYPGGAFDPLGFSKDSSKVAELRLKEIKNGRLAMVAFLGFVLQNEATGKGPVAALGEHLKGPWTSNFATNGISLPF